MLTLERRTLYRCWKHLNEGCLNGEFFKSGVDALTPQLVRSRDFALAFRDLVLSSWNGFGLPAIDNPPLESNMRARVKLLEKRYVDEELWREGVARLEKNGPKLFRKSCPPTAISMILRRKGKGRAQMPGAVPSGGGCLQSFSFVRWRDEVQVTAVSRASEIGYRLVADMYLLKHLIERVISETGMDSKMGGVDQLRVRWTFLLAQQVKPQVVRWMMERWNPEDMKAWFSEEPRHPWQAEMQRFFYTRFIHPPRDPKWKMRWKPSWDFLAKYPLEEVLTWKEKT